VPTSSFPIDERRSVNACDVAGCSETMLRGPTPSRIVKYIMGAVPESERNALAVSAGAWAPQIPGDPPPSAIAPDCWC
jgi:hypothetical protein